MTITLCNSHPFTFYLPFHTSLRADQCPIHVPSTCTLGLDPCARHSLFGRTDPYYIDNFYYSCGLKRLAATLASPLLCNCTVLPVPLSTGPYLGPRTWIFWGKWYVNYQPDTYVLFLFRPGSPFNSRATQTAPAMTAPVCGADGATYFSPRHAGCTVLNRENEMIYVRRRLLILSPRLAQIELSMIMHFLLMSSPHYRRDLDLK